MTSLNTAQEQEVTFISGVASNGTLAPTSFWTWNQDNPASYSITDDNETKWGPSHAGTGGGVITYAFAGASAWTATEQNAFVMSMALWSAEANISFVPDTGTNAPDVVITRGSDGSANGGDSGFQGNIGTTRLGQTTSGQVSIDTSVTGFGPIGASFSDFGGYPWMTVLHELGHVLGLGHAGPYNGTDNPTTQELSGYDQRAYSLMSYIDPQDVNSALTAGLPSFSWGLAKGDDGLNYRNEPTTPMELDIAAIQRVYGAPTSGPLSAGGQVFGFHSNIGGLIQPFFDFTQNTRPVITLYDGGHNNTLDLSGYSSNSTIDLHDGDFSSCAGMTNNLCIAIGTAIDTAIGGSGGDGIIANDDGDTLVGGGGADALFGGAGTDTFKYLAFSDSTAANPDGVFNFQTGVDKVDVSALQASAVSLVRSGGSTFLFADGTGGHLQINFVGESLNGNDVITGGTNHGGLYLIGDNNGDTLIGSSLGDPIQGGTGNDTFIGGAGADAIFSGGGNDTFVYQAYSDSPSNAGDGIFGFVTAQDKVDLTALATTNVSLIRSGGSTFLFADGAGPSDHLQITFINGLVNGNDILTGSTHGVFLIGDNSGDTLIGSANGDPIQGGTGNDIIIGGGGGDALFGGAGSNTFKYVAASDSTTSAPDSIFDFVSGKDKIDLSAVRESATDAFGVLNQAGSTFIFVHLDPGQADAHDMTIILNGTTSITASDIIWGTAPTHEVAAVSSTLGESMAHATPVSSGGGTVSGALLDSGHAGAVSFMPTMMDPHDPLNSLMAGNEFLAYQHQHDQLA